jgi:hypothetical protein
MYCASSGHECKITMVRKQRPFYYASEEQYRWLQIIASKINPNANLNDVAQLKEIAESLEGSEVLKRESLDDDRGNTEMTAINLEQEEGMEGVVDGIGTLMLDPLGRPSNLTHENRFNGRVYWRIRFSRISSESERVYPIATT